MFNVHNAIIIQSSCLSNKKIKHLSRYGDISLGNPMDLESKLIKLISSLLFPSHILIKDKIWFWGDGLDVKAISLITQIISLISSMDLKSQPKPESEFMSLIAQTVSVFNSMDLDSQPKPLLELISLLSRKNSLCNSTDSDSNKEVESELESLLPKTLSLDPEPRFMSLIHQIIFLAISTVSKFISLCPQVRVRFKNGKYHAREEGISYSSTGKWNCLPANWNYIGQIDCRGCNGQNHEECGFPGEYATYFHCESCNGKNHEEYSKALVEIRHHLHRKHTLQLVLLEKGKVRKCYCCDEDLEMVFYCCLSCHFSINVVCAKKPPVLSIDPSKWHEHTLALFPRHASLTCNLCALINASSPLYMCPPCDFVVHLRCINLPRVIRISRHHHRISFSPSLDQGDLSCGYCRRKMDSDYGGYSCIKDCCSYAAHSKCATQSNVWDGKELEGEPEEDIEEVEPFNRISEGIIQHSSHEHHHLRLDENMNRDYDENMECQACITPIYFGNLYSCMQCDFILHEECANLSRKIYHPIHPHLLTLGYVKVVDERARCDACTWYCTSGFFYRCSEQGCSFKLDVRCATISEPLVHESHIHPLFLTSKPGDGWRICSVCNESRYSGTNETFNCIECDFALCFRCATLPHKVRYKHDKHELTLSYGVETSTMKYWCELCEGKINPKQRFYMCDEYCCITLHIECLLGQDIYVKPGSSWIQYEKKTDVLPNNHHMSRPICSSCKKRCPHQIVLQWSGSIICSLSCFLNLLMVS